MAADVVAHYSPPVTRRTSLLEHERRVSATTIQAAGRQHAKQRQRARHPGASVSVGDSNDDADDKDGNTTTFFKQVQITLNEPVGSMSISPANRDVVLAAREGLFILDLENPYDQPRFLPHMTVWLPADVQWNPHPFRSNWVASTSNQKLLVWNLDRPAAPRIEPILSMPVTSGTKTTSSSSTNNLDLMAATFGGHSAASTLPHPHHQSLGTANASVSRLSSISHVLHAHTRAITDINWSPFHPEVLASCSIDTWTWSWDLREPSRPRQGYSAWNAAMTQVKWNRASPHRLATSCDNKVLIWDDRKGALPLATIEAHESRIYGIDWSRDTSLGLDRLVTCSLDGSVKYWDLSSEASQEAIGQRKLVTECETLIETRTPVWRARNLPFGQGVMTLPQRGDTSLSMWSKEAPEAPVHRFEGHTDTVKEYLFRTRGGADKSNDDRQFQLITWSKDQTLRLWPVTQEMTKAVGHRPGNPIRTLQTRTNAADITYRVPPLISTESAGAGAASTASAAAGAGSGGMILEGNVLASSSPIQSSNTLSAHSSNGTTPAMGTSFLPPAGLTRSLLSGSGPRGQMPGSNSTKLSATPPYSSSYHATGTSPVNLRLASSLGAHQQAAAAAAAAANGTFGSSYGARSSQQLGSNSFGHASGRNSALEPPLASASAASLSGHSGFDQRHSILRKQSSAFELGLDGDGRHSRQSKSTTGSRHSHHHHHHHHKQRGVGMGPLSESIETGDSGKSKREAIEEHRRRKEKKKKAAAAAAAAAASLASSGFMTRGTTSSQVTGGAWRMSKTGGSKMPGAGSGRDAVGWIANVRMGEQADERPGTSSVAASVAGLDSSTHLPHNGEGGSGEETASKDAAQVVSEEIVAISKNLRGVSFEKIDVSTRTVIVSCYGPWADKNSPAFMRLTLIYPSSYPSKPPKYKLEHNASVSLKTRAFLLKNLSRVMSEYALPVQQQQRLRGVDSRTELPVLSEACIRFLLGESSREAGPMAYSPDNETDLEDETDDEARHGDTEDKETGSRDMAAAAPPSPPPALALRIPPRRSGATFGPRGLLVTFSPSMSQRDLERIAAERKSSFTDEDGKPPSVIGDRKMAGHSGTAATGMRMNRSGAGVSGGGGGGGGGGLGGQSGRARFLQSYSTLSGAMASLARLAREGTDVQDLDVMQLMGDQNFLDRRIHRSHSKGDSSQKRGSRMGSLAPSGSARAFDSADRSYSRVTGRRARSASPMPGSSSSRGRETMSRLGGKASGAFTHSDVRIWELKQFVPPLVAPAFLRRRSSSLPSSSIPPSPHRHSTPASPASVAPRRARGDRSAFASLAVPASLNTDTSERDLGPSWIDYDSPSDAGEEDDEEEHRSHQPFDENGPRIQEINEDGDGEDHDEGEKEGDDSGSSSDGEDDDADDDEEDDADRLLRASEDAQMHPALESTLDTFIWSMPFCFLYLLMDIMIQQQYAMHPTPLREFGRLLGTLPLLVFFIWATSVRGRPAVPVRPTSNFLTVDEVQGDDRRRRGQLAFQLGFFVLSLAVGIGFVYTYTESTFDLVTRRIAPLGTLWVYCLVKLDLTWAVLNLAIVWGFVKVWGLNLFN